MSAASQLSAGNAVNPMISRSISKTEDDRGVSSKKTVVGVTSFATLSQWVRRYGKREQKSETRSAIFVDQSGVHRYVSNWQAVPLERVVHEQDAQWKRRAEYTATGCTQIDVFCTVDDVDVLINPSVLTDSHIVMHNDGVRGQVVKASFLNDWQRLWHCMEKNDDDEVANQAPLFRQAVDVLFHRRTYQLTLFIFFYNVASAIVALVVYPPHLKFYSTGVVIELIEYAIRLLAYTSVYILFRGSLPSFFSVDRPSVVTVHHAGASDMSVLPSRTNYFTLHWVTSLRQILVHCWRTLPSLMVEMTSDDKEVNKTGRLISRTHNQSFYDLLNISLKFLLKHNGDGPRDFQWNTVTYRLLLLLATVIVPLYMLALAAIEWVSVTLPECSTHPDGALCQYYRFRSMLMLGGLTPAIGQAIFGSSVIVGLVGMAYGGEVAFQLSDSWIQKFCCLRRLDLNNSDDVCHKLNSSPVRNEDQSLSSPSTSKEYLDSIDHPSGDQLLVEKQIIAALISRDATEHYLFMRAMISAADRTWGFPILGLLLITLYVTLSYLVYIIAVLHSDEVYIVIWLALFVVVRVVVFLVFPVLSICHANSFIYKMRECFMGASAEDFAVMGGKDHWTSLMESNPVVWTVFGLWVTWEKLFGVIWTAVAAGIALVVSKLSKNAL